MENINPEATYKPRQIAKLGVIKHTRGNASYYYILDLIHSGKLKAENLDTPKGKYFGVKGSEIIQYIKKNNLFYPELHL